MMGSFEKLANHKFIAVIVAVKMQNRLSFFSFRKAKIINSIGKTLLVVIRRKSASVDFI